MTAAVCIATAGSGGAQDTGPGMAPVSPGGPATFRRLSEDQYKRSIAQIFGPDITVPGRFEPDVRADGLLAIGNSRVVVTPSGLEQYSDRAQEIAVEVLGDAHRATYLTCGPKTPAQFDAACAQQFLARYGRLLFRRPLSKAELKTAMDMSVKGTQALGSFDKGLETGLASLLVSPYFIFRLETSEVDPAAPARRRLDAYSLATRISFLLWNSPPDDQLLDAAASGALYTDAGLKAQVDRLMASPKLVDGVRAFFSDMFGYDQFDGLSKDPALYPIFSPQLRNDAQEQGLRTIVNELITENGDYRDLFTTRKTFLTRPLAALYGVKVDYRGFSGGWMPYTFPADDPHRGLLTLPGFLMLDPSHEGRSSPTIRGKNVRQNFLCQPVPNPPANVNFSIVQNTSDPVHKTARERLIAHQDNPVCAGCHAITDPIGLSLENYNPVGTWRIAENGATIDPSGKFSGKGYADAVQLMTLLHGSPATTSCAVQRVFEYGVGRKETPGEQPWLEWQRKAFAQSGYRFPALLRSIAQSPAFHAVSSINLAAN